MQYSIIINQKQGIELGLNSFDKMAVFSMIFEAYSWCDRIDIDGTEFIWINRHTICEMLPALNVSDKTIYRYFKEFHDFGLIIYEKYGKKDCIRITEKGFTYKYEQKPSNTKSDSKIPKTGFQNPKNGISKSTDSINNNNINKNNNKKSENKFSDDLQIENIVNKLIENIDNLDGNYKTPKKGDMLYLNWCTHIGRMLEYDKVSYEKTLQMLEWMPDEVTNNNWCGWVKVVRSAEKFRQKWEDIYITYEQQTKGQRQQIDEQAQKRENRVNNYVKYIDTYKLKTISDFMKRFDFAIKSDVEEAYRRYNGKA